MDTKALAKTLREQMTPAENVLWMRLRRKALGVKFRRQAPIGPYVVDFVCLSHRLIVEVDGSQHGEPEADAVRDAYLTREGFRVLRFWNHEVMHNPLGVLEAITLAMSP